MDSLETIGKKHRTDKTVEIGHGYLPVYEALFDHRRNDPLVIMELGVCRGLSLRMWKEYFINSKIIGVDIDDRCLRYKEDRIETLVSDLSKAEDIEILKTKIPFGIDYIIDDASHHVDDIIMAHSCLWDLVNPGGAYIIEDTSRAFLDVREHPIRGNRFQGTRMIDYFGKLITSLNGDGRPNTHNYARMKKEGYPYANDWTQRIEEVSFRAEMIIIKYRKTL